MQFEILTIWFGAFHFDDGIMLVSSTYNIPKFLLIDLIIQLKDFVSFGHINIEMLNIALLSIN